MPYRRYSIVLPTKTGYAKSSLLEKQTVIAACLCVTGGLFFLFNAYAADNSADEEAARLLSEIRKHIDALQSNLTERHARVDELRQAITQAEQALETARAEQQRYQQKINDKAGQLDTLKEQRRATQGMLAKHHATLAGGVRNAFVLARQGKHKLLLNSDNPAELTRRLGYHDYLLQATDQNLSEANEQLTRIETLENSIQLEQDNLRQLQNNAAAHLQEVDALKSTHAKSLLALRSQIADDETRLARLRDDERKLLELLDEIQASRTLDDERRTIPLNTLKGRLPWPDAGNLARAPGSAHRAGGAKWQGVLIETDRGAEVTSISAGQIVFADRFRSLGLLVIIDHGDGFLSLYGYNDVIFKAAGDWVDSNEIIATVGSTGNGQRSALYFELRRDGEALDPRDWCAAR